MAPHGLRCMHPNRYSNRCEIIQPPSLMTAHMNSVSSEYPLWVNLHSSKWSGSQDTPRPATASPQGGEAFHLPSKTPEEWWRVANQSLRPCPHHTSSRKRKRIAGHSVCPSSCPPVAWDRDMTLSGRESPPPNPPRLTRATHTGGVHAPCRAQMPQQCGATPHLDMRSRDAPFWHLRPACPGIFLNLFS